MSLELRRLRGYTDFPGPVVCVILDGVGIGAQDESDGVYLAYTPVLDRLFVEDSSRHLNSVGGGARYAFNRFFLDAAVAVPLTHVGLLDRKPDPRVLISLTTRLWPWSLR